MSKRVLVAAMHHESNSFNPIITDEGDFTVARGGEIFDRLGPNDSLSGIVYTLLGMGWEVVPLISARAFPNGFVSRRLYEDLKRELLDRALDALNEGPVDAVTLSLHGSMRVEGLGAAEGDLLESLRRMFPVTPILASLDMHATMSRAMHQNCDGFVGYKCAPHTDCSETGAHAARITIDVLEKGRKPVASWHRIPVLIAGEKSETSTEPMVSLIGALRECEGRPGIMAASFLMGFPWADHDNHGVAAYVVADGDAELARKESRRLAELFWDVREEFSFHTETHPPEKALDAAFQAASSGPCPVYVSDSGDNPTAGSSGDGTELVALFMDDPRTSELSRPVLFGGIYDPDAVGSCRGRVGETLSLEFGAAFDAGAGRRLKKTGIVKAFVDSWGDYRTDMALFAAEGVDLVLVSQHIGYIGPDLFEALGADPRERLIVVCKLGYLTDPHKRIARRSIMALTRGSTNEDLTTIDYRLLNRPIFPLDWRFADKEGVRSMD